MSLQISQENHVLEWKCQNIDTLATFHQSIFENADGIFENAFYHDDWTHVQGHSELKQSLTDRWTQLFK